MQRCTTLALFRVASGLLLVYRCWRVLEPFAPAIFSEDTQQFMAGVLGTALAQALVAITGLFIAGVPHAFLLGALTFVLSMAPIGPPLIWGRAAIRLFRNGDAGWAIFMILDGAFGISSIDNVVKSFLISRSGRAPFAFAFMGVLGGLLAFGISGVFIGPALLAVAIGLAKQLDRSAPVMPN